MKKLLSKTNSQPLPRKSLTKGRRGVCSRAIIPGILAVTAFTLAGCAGHSKNHFTVGSVPSNYKKNHPIIVDEQEQVLDIPIASSAYALPIASASAVQGFAHAFSTSASRTITVLVPTGSPNESAARKVSADVVETLKKTGIPIHRIRTTGYHAAQHGSAAPIRLSYNAIKASVSGCGKWPDDLVADKGSENKNYHNFGCGSQSNLASMVANPADLLGPRGSSSIDASRRTTAIEDYRSGPQQEIQTPETLYPR